MSFRKLSCVMVVSALAAGAGCGGDRSGGGAAELSGPQATPAAGPPKESAVEVTEYQLKGVVRKIEKAFDSVTIRHEAIPGFMPAMQMPFHYKDRTFLDKLRPGDTVEGTLRVERAQGAVREYELLSLSVTKAATPAPAIALDISRKQALMREEPRRLEIGDPVPDFAMTSQDGQTVKLSDLRGHVVVLTFIYTRCPLPDFCPLMDKKFSDLAQRIGVFPARANKIRLISLSFDPEHDTPDLLRKHAQVRGATPPLWSYAVASHAELAKIGGSLGLFYQPGDNEIAHNLCTAIIDAAGKLARLEIGTERNKWSSTDLQKTIYALLPATAQ
jgi:protein SCO1